MSALGIHTNVALRHGERKQSTNCIRFFFSCFFLRHWERKQREGGTNVAKTWRKKAEYRWYFLLRYAKTKQSTDGTNVAKA